MHLAARDPNHPYYFPDFAASCEDLQFVQFIPPTQRLRIGLSREGRAVSGDEHLHRPKRADF